MSEQDVCRFWCMIHDERRPFSVIVGRRWNVEELTKAIQQERHRLQSIDIIDLFLWKVRLFCSPALTFLLTCRHSWIIPFQLATTLFPNFFLNQSLISLSIWTIVRRSCRTSFHIFLRTTFISSWNCLVSKYMVICVWETDNLSLVPLLFLNVAPCPPSDVNPAFPAPLYVSPVDSSASCKMVFPISVNGIRSLTV